MSPHHLGLVSKPKFVNRLDYNFDRGLFTYNKLHSCQHKPMWEQHSGGGLLTELVLGVGGIEIAVNNIHEVYIGQLACLVDYLHRLGIHGHRAIHTGRAHSPIIYKSKRYNTIIHRSHSNKQQQQQQQQKEQKRKRKSPCPTRNPWHVSLP